MTDSQPSLTVPSPARMYDYFLHGSNNFPADRAAAEQVIEKFGVTQTRTVVWENRLFLGRAVTFLARDCGIDQFIDVGAGLPSMENTHQVAQRHVPGARVVYVDNDPVVAEDGQRMFTGPAAETTRIITADLRQPQAILNHPATRELIDFSRPVAVLIVAVLHFIRPEERPAELVNAFRERMSPGSYLALSHLSVEGASAEEQAGMEESYRDVSAPMVYRERAEVASWFDGMDLVEPGLTSTGLWRPDASTPETTHRMLAGVARQPRQPGLDPAA